MVKPTLLISRCLLGEAVRYDGNSKAAPQLINTLHPHCTLLGVCPEVEAGLDVPRPPVELVQQPGQTIARGRDDHTLDVTHPLLHFSTTYRATIQGAILQNRSPSCGVGDTPLFNPEGEKIGEQDGLFTAALRTSYPHLPITSPNALQNKMEIKVFLQQVFAYAHNQYQSQ